MGGRRGTGTAGHCPGPPSAGNILWAGVVPAGRNTTSCGAGLEGKVAATPVPAGGAAVVAAAATEAAVASATTAPGVARVAAASMRISLVQTLPLLRDIIDFFDQTTIHILRYMPPKIKTH